METVVHTGCRPLGLRAWQVPVQMTGRRRAASCAARPDFAGQVAVMRARAKGRAPTIAVPAAAPLPDPAPFRSDDGEDGVVQLGPMTTTRWAATVRSHSIVREDPNHGYTWLDHPCPWNPFRSKADQDMWYVPPTLEQRKCAQDLGLPLYGIL